MEEMKARFIGETQEKPPVTVRARNLPPWFQEGQRLTPVSSGVKGALTMVRGSGVSWPSSQGFAQVTAVGWTWT